MSTCEMSRTDARADAPADAHPNATDALHRVKELARRDPQFAAALRTSDSPQSASDLARRHGIDVSAAALWRHRGTLAHGGVPTWRG